MVRLQILSCIWPKQCYTLFTTLLFWWMYSSDVSAQNPVSIAEIPEVVVKQYTPSKPLAGDVALLDMAFAQYQSLSPWVIEAVKNWAIDSVHLVYTDYPKGVDFSSLNQQRLQTIYDLLPELKSEENIRWRVYKQVGAKDFGLANEFYHGFAIYYRKILPVTNNLPVDPIAIAKREEFISNKFDNAVDRKMNMKPLDDGTTRQIFERNTSIWDSVVVVADWTGSMYPYTFQVLKWTALANQREKILAYIFFNDGDMQKSSSKVIGQTKGIYPTTDTRIYAVLDTMAAVKARGDGGELEENDFEALLYAIERFPEAKEYLLIADNASEVRDTLLMDQITKPVRVLLARLEKHGQPLEVYEPYAELAVKTGGSLHTATNDYYSARDIWDFVSQQKEYVKESRKVRQSSDFSDY